MKPEVDILVVDDRPEDRLAIEGMLRAGDYNVVTAATGSEALRRVLESDFAVILLDVVLPDIGGLEVARIIKQRERSRLTPVIFLTAADPDLRMLYKGYAAGAIDYLAKPIDADVLRAKTAVFVEIFRKDLRIRAQAEALREADQRERQREMASVVLDGRRRYENLAEAMPGMVWIADPDGRVVYVNKRWAEYTGEAAELTRQRGIAAGLDPADVTNWAQRWEMARLVGSVFDVTCRVRRRDGALRWHSCRAVPERDPDGAIVAWLGTLTDQDDLHRACESAESAVRARDAFLSLASHELRTPLTTLQLRLRSLESRLGFRGASSIDAESLAPLLGSALRQTERLLRLVDDLLDISRIATGNLVLQPEAFDVRSAAYEIVDRFDEAARTAGCALTVDAPESIEGRWDRLRVEQALQNLLANALRYAPGAPIEISVRRDGEDAVLRVRDHGPGVPADSRERIFERDGRSSRTPHVGGLGLGLYIVREIARAHGGRAFVETPHDGGAAFVVRLPVAAARAAEGPVRSTSSGAGFEEGGEHGSRDADLDVAARARASEPTPERRGGAEADRTDAEGRHSRA